MSTTFLVTLEDDGRCTVNKLSDPVSLSPPMPGVSPVAMLRDPSFEPAVLNDGERVDIHVKLSETIKRDVIITLLDDTVPVFSNQQEADEWLAQRESGTRARYG